MKQSHQCRSVALLLVTTLMTLLACERSITPPRQEPSAKLAYYGNCPPDVPCDTRPMTPAETDEAFTDLFSHYFPNSPYPECDGILNMASDRLGSGAVSWWTNAPAGYWGDNHSLTRNIHLSQWTWGNSLEKAKTLFHESAHLYFGASTHEATINYFMDECLG